VNRIQWLRGVNGLAASPEFFAHQEARYAAQPGPEFRGLARFGKLFLDHLQRDRQLEPQSEEVTGNVPPQ
jgi:hypothetical protein